MAVGQAIGGGVPEHLDIVSIEELIADRRRFERFADETHDARMGRYEWRRVLRVELHGLISWVARRLLHAGRSEHTVSVTPASDATLVLLPRYGFALHTLRRAVPLATLGLRATVSVPAEVLAQAYAPIAAVSTQLGLGDMLALSDESPPKLVLRAARDGQAVFFTGRRATCQALQRSHPGTVICGATGRCTVVISASHERARAVARHLHERAVPTSCSNLGVALVAQDYTSEAKVAVCEVTLEDAADWADGGSTVGAIVRRAHPSMILIADPDERMADPQDGIEGYRAVRCDSDGVPRTLQGFGRDPVCGWPGDGCL